MTGAGKIAGERYASGVYANGYNNDYLNPDGTVGSAPDLAAITANSLTVLSPEGGRGHADHLNSLTAHGPHYEHLRLLWTERERFYPQAASAGRRMRPPGMSRCATGPVGSSVGGHGRRRGVPGRGLPASTHGDDC